MIYFNYLEHINFLVFILLNFISGIVSAAKETAIVSKLIFNIII